MSKPTLVVFPEMLKAHVAGYTRKDGAFVKEHDDKRAAAKPAGGGKPAPAPASFDLGGASAELKKKGYETQSQNGGLYVGSGGDTKLFGDKEKAQWVVDDLASMGFTAKVVGKYPMAVRITGRSTLAKAHVDQYVRKDGSVVQAHDDKRQAAAPKPAGAGPAAPKPGEVGHHEHTEYGAYFRPGDKVKDQTGKTHEVAEHRGASVRTKGGEMFHPTKLKHAAEPRLALPVKKAAAKPAPAKTGSAAPARMTNVGSEKYPLLAKNSDKLAAKHDDGSTHHVGGFEPPSNGKGDHMVHHDGKLFSFTGKSGKNMKTGEASYEYSHQSDSGDHRAWVTHSGHLMND